MNEWSPCSCTEASLDDPKGLMCDQCAAVAKRQRLRDYWDIVVAHGIDPRTAHLTRLYVGRDYGCIQRDTIDAYCWYAPNEGLLVADEQMELAWPEFHDRWDELSQAAWTRRIEDDSDAGNKVPLNYAWAAGAPIKPNPDLIRQFPWEAPIEEDAAPFCDP